MGFALDIQLVKANGTVYIRSNGNVEGTDKIQRNGNIYTLTDNICGEIVVEKDNIVVDGAGCTVQGTGAYLSKGIYLLGRSNLTVRNTTIRNFWWGITLNSTSKVTLCENNIADTNGSGIMLDRSSHNSISWNIIANNDGSGIYLGTAISFAEPPLSDYNDITENNITNNQRGIYLDYSEENSIVGNNITNNNYGIWLWHSSDYNSISGNNIVNNSWSGIYLSYSSNNKFWHNNFIDNTQQVHYDSGYANFWDDGLEGNYWSNYTAVDYDHDGIGDSWHTIDENNEDHYPLMGLFSDLNATSKHRVQTICNSTISNFQFNGTAISFTVSGDNGTSGFCRICIPTALMNDTYRVFVNGTEILPSPEPLPCSNSTYSYIYFNYTHSTKEIIIVPGFPSLLLLQLFMIITLLAVIAYRRKNSKVYS
jgi:parallel beta-helix repeat protein